MVANKDFSIFALFAAGLATLVRADDGPTANAVRLPGLGDILPAGERYDIKWDADTPYAGGTVTLILLKGPSTNAVPYATIASGTENDGSFEWYPSTDLEDSNGATGYGIKMVIDANGAYQYTTQFGISNNKVVSSSSAVASSAAVSSVVASSAASSAASVKVESVATSAAPSSTVAAAGNETYVTEVVTAYTTICPVATEIAHGGKTYTATAGATLTISDCPNGCTVTKPVYTSIVTACATCSASTSPAAAVATTAAVKGGSSPNPPYAPISNGTVSYSKPALGSATTPGVAGTPAATTPGSAMFTGAAAAVKVTGAFSAAIAMGAAFFAL